MGKNVGVGGRKNLHKAKTIAFRRYFILLLVEFTICAEWTF